jgi:hypothetical protein
MTLLTEEEKKALRKENARKYYLQRREKILEESKKRYRIKHPDAKTYNSSRWGESKIKDYNEYMKLYMREYNKKDRSHLLMKYLVKLFTS